MSVGGVTSHFAVEEADSGMWRAGMTDAHVSQSAGGEDTGPPGRPADVHVTNDAVGEI
jgi:hypothetical protein